MNWDKTLSRIFAGGAALLIILILYQVSRPEFGRGSKTLNDTVESRQLYRNDIVGVEFALQPTWIVNENRTYQGSRRMTLLTIVADSVQRSPVVNVRFTDSGWNNFAPIYRQYHLRQDAGRNISAGGIEALRFPVKEFGGHYARLEKDSVIYEFAGSPRMLDQIFGTLRWTEKSRPADRVLTSRRVSGQTLPKEVAAWVENCLKLDLHAFSLTKAFGNDTYVFVTVGRRPTGGYETRVVEVAQRGNQEVTVRTRFMRPEPDRLVTQALTTPFDVIAIERTELPVRVIPEGNDAPRWIASLVGIDDLPPIVAESRSIKVFTPPPRHVVERSIQVTGVASTTEGTIHYRLLDGDNRIMDGYMTAAQSLAWGYFAKEISVPGSVHATDSLTLELFSIDEREGEETDLVSVALRFEPQRMLK